MAKKKKAPKTNPPISSIGQSTFSQIGNLTFYDGWNPDYVYFNSLYKAGEQYTTSKGTTSWNPTFAQPIAQQAISDALGHQFLINNSVNDSNSYFEKQFTQKIIPFLEKACSIEQANERAWIQTKLNEIKYIFKDKADYSAIRQLVKLLNAADNGEVKIQAIITLINVLLQGIKNTQIITSHEKKRITDINNTLGKLLRSRRHQTQGLFQDKNLEERLRISNDSGKRLWNKISVEYIKSARLDRQENIKDTFGNVTGHKYVLFGGKQFSQIQRTVPGIISEWAQATMKDILQNPQVLSTIVDSISKEYDFLQRQSLNALKSNIRQIIGLAILEYGKNNLASLLNKNIDEAAITSIEKELISNKELFNTARTLQLNITGLRDEDFGYKITSPEILKTTEQFTDLYDKKATELYAIIDFATQRMTKAQLEDSALLKILDNKAYTEGRNWEQTRQIFDLIHSVEAISDEMQRMEEEYKKNKENAIKKIHLPQNTNALITISVINGQVKVEQSELITAIQGTTVYQDFMRFKEFSPTTLTRTIATLKRNASINLKNDIINSIRAGVNKIDPDELVQKLKIEIQKIEVDVQGCNVAELLSSMNFSSSGHNLVAQTGARKSKNDGIVIHFRYQDLVQQLSQKIQNMAQGKLKKDYEEAEKKYEKARQEFYTQWYETVADSAQKANQKGDDNLSTRYSAQIEKNLKHAKELGLNDAWNNLQEIGTDYIEYLNEQIKPKDRSDEKKRYENFLENFLNNSFFVSTTVKTADTYVNNIGFHGGKLGNTLDMQLSNVGDIFKSAGMELPEDELKWMKFAIINCFEGSVLGTGNKNIIENYLGSLMAFALFDEGGAESALISNFYQTYFKSMEKVNSPSILHLYYVDGIYVPGSVVLKRTLNTLKQQVLPAIQTEIPNTMRRGAGIAIENTMSEKNVPNRPIAQNIEAPDTNAWATVGNEANKHVKLKILFLAGLLDIINGINKTIGKLQLPQ